jgi:hypothetical protein
MGASVCLKSQGLQGKGYQYYVIQRGGGGKVAGLFGTLFAHQHLRERVCSQSVLMSPCASTRVYIYVWRCGTASTPLLLKIPMRVSSSAGHKKLKKQPLGFHADSKTKTPGRCGP